MPDVIHSTEQYENNRAEQSHEPSEPLYAVFREKLGTTVLRLKLQQVAGLALQVFANGRQGLKAYPFHLAAL